MVRRALAPGKGCSGTAEAAACKDGGGSMQGWRRQHARMEAAACKADMPERQRPPNLCANRTPTFPKGRRRVEREGVRQTTTDMLRITFWRHFRQEAERWAHASKRSGKRSATTLRHRHKHSAFHKGGGGRAKKRQRLAKRARESLGEERRRKPENRGGAKTKLGEKNRKLKACVPRSVLGS